MDSHLSDPAPGAALDESASGLWRGTSRADRDEARRERLVEAALELYGTQGFRSTSIQALCHESGVSSRSFYELFPARDSSATRPAITAQESLLEELYIVLNEEIAESLASLSIPADVSLLDATVAVVSTALMPMLRDERKARVLEVEAVGVNESVEDRRREMMRLLAAAVESAFVQLQSVYRLPLARPPLPAEGGGLTSLVLVGGITEALVQRVHTPADDRTPTSSFLTQIAEVALRSFGVGEESFGLGRADGQCAGT